jgi:hypothetical protein
MFRNEIMNLFEHCIHNVSIYLNVYQLVIKYIKVIHNSKIIVHIDFLPKLLQFKSVHMYVTYTMKIQLPY